MGAGKQPRFAAALQRPFRSTRYSPSIQHEMRFDLAAGPHQRMICLRLPGLRSVAGKAERHDSPVGLESEAGAPSLIGDRWGDYSAGDCLIPAAHHRPRLSNSAMASPTNRGDACAETKDRFVRRAIRPAQR